MIVVKALEYVYAAYYALLGVGILIGEVVLVAIGIASLMWFLRKRLRKRYRHRWNKINRREFEVIAVDLVDHCLICRYRYSGGELFNCGETLAEFGDSNLVPQEREWLNLYRNAIEEWAKHHAPYQHQELGLWRQPVKPEE